MTGVTFRTASSSIAVGITNGHVYVRESHVIGSSKEP